MLLKPCFLGSRALLLSGGAMGRYDIERIGVGVKLERALALPDANGDKPLRLKRIGDQAYHYYCKLSKTADLDMAIAAYDPAVKLVLDGHQCQAELLSRFGCSLSRRFAYSGNFPDIDNAIVALE